MHFRNSDKITKRKEESHVCEDVTLRKTGFPRCDCFEDV